MKRFILPLSITGFVLIVLLVVGYLAGNVGTQPVQTATEIPTVDGAIIQAYPLTQSTEIQSNSTLIEGFPAFPIFPGAKLETSSKRTQSLNTARDIRAVWKVEQANVVTIMNWYLDELERTGWAIEYPDDRASKGEQIAWMTKNNYRGYLAVEDEKGEYTEIVVDFQKLNE